MAKLTVADHQATLLGWKKADYSEVAAAEAADLSRGGFQARMRSARRWLKTAAGQEWAKVHGIGDAPRPEIINNHLLQQLREAQRKLLALEGEKLSTSQFREHVFGLAAQRLPRPEWINARDLGKHQHGIPSLFLSDIHYGEKVVPAQVFNCNEFNAEIAVARVRRVIDKTNHLLHDVLRDPKFPGIILILGGDNINGYGMHPDLDAAADRMVMQQAYEIADVLHAVILKLVKQYGRVHVPAVAGNHGRDTRKPWAAFYAETNFDWLVYNFLERVLASEIADGSVTIDAPPARDLTYRVAGRGFRLTHGDQFRGGDSIIGPLGPVTRGDQKKRAMALSLPTSDEEYDTLLVAHFHKLYQAAQLIMNGCIKGYDAYSLSNNFPFEVPQQSLFLTHPKYGINHFMPVLADEPKVVKGVPWLEFRERERKDDGHKKWVES